MPKRCISTSKIPSAVTEKPRRFRIETFEQFSRDELRNALRLIHQVLDARGRSMSRQASTGQGGCLSPRERVVLLWIKEGKTNWEISRILNLSERTVRFHVGHIFEKLDVTSRTQAVVRAIAAGLIGS